MSSFAGAAEMLRAQKQFAGSEKQRKFPYPWLEPPPASIHFSPFGNLTIQNTGSNMVVLSYTIPEGFTGVLAGVVVDVEATNGTPVAWGAGDIDWSIVLNFTSISGSPGIPAFRYFQNFVKIPFTVGQFGASGTGDPWPIWSGESDLLPSKTVISILADVNGNTGGWIPVGPPPPPFPEWRASLSGYKFPNQSIT